MKNTPEGTHSYISWIVGNNSSLPWISVENLIDSEPRIELATPEDLEIILWFFQSAMESEKNICPDFEIPDIYGEEFASEIQNDLENMEKSKAIYFLLIIWGKKVGFINWFIDKTYEKSIGKRENPVHFDYIFIEENYRRKGFSQKKACVQLLIEKLENWAKNQHSDYIFWQAFKENTRAISVYKKLDYRILKEENWILFLGKEL